jgi:hypothetical protein
MTTARKKEKKAKNVVLVVGTYQNLKQSILPFDNYEPKPVKQEVNGTVILPYLVFDDTVIK